MPDEAQIIKNQPTSSLLSAGTKLKNTLFKKPGTSELPGRELLKNARQVSISYGNSGD